MGVFETLRERVDLAELAARHTDLAPSGRALVGRCPRPDHDDESPSFHVYPDGRFISHLGTEGLEPTRESQNTQPLEVRFSAKLGDEREVELALV